MRMIRPFCLVMALLGLTGVSFAADPVIYREMFPTGPNAAASGWQYHVGTRARDASKQKCWANAPGAGKLNAINSKPAEGAQAWRGSVWLAHGTAYLFWTDEYLPGETVTAISWHMALKNTTDRVHVAVQVDSDHNGRDANDPWLISAKSFGHERTPVKQVKQAPRSSLSMTDAKWLPLTFTPGRALTAAKARAQSLPKGKIVAFGLYASKRTDTHSFDTFALHATTGVADVPTPPTATKATASALNSIERKPEPPIKRDDGHHPAFGQVVIGGGGYMTGVYPSRAQPGLAYLIGDMVGPWIRRDYDHPWTLGYVMGDFEPSVYDVPHASNGGGGAVLHPTNPLIAYVDIGNGAVYDGPIGVFKTIDGGKTWQHKLQKYTAGNQDRRKPLTGSRKWGPSLAIDLVNPEVVYWATRKDGVWRTLDGGANWTQVLNAETPTRNVVVDPSEQVNGRAKTIYVGAMDKGMYVSHDGGDSFQLDADFNAIAGKAPVTMWLRAADDGVIYAATRKHIMRHDDEDWHDITPAPGEKGRLYSVATNPHDSRQVITTRGKTLYRSKDHGNTWQVAKVAHDRNRAWFRRFRFNMALASLSWDPHRASTVYSADVFGTWKTRNIWAEVVQWEHHYRGAEITVTIELCTPRGVAEQDIAPLISGVSDVRGFRHHDIHELPHNFIMAPGDYSTYVTGLDFCEADPNIVYACKAFAHGKAKVLRSENNGRTWRELPNPLPEQKHSGGKISVSATDPNRAVYFPSQKHPPMVTSDGGKTWGICTLTDGSPVPFVYDKGGAYNFAAAQVSDRVDGSTFYVYSNSNKRKDESPRGLMISRDGGVTWQPSDTKLGGSHPHDSISPPHIDAMPDQAGELWLALGGGGIWRSTDYGKTAQKITHFENARPNMLAIGAADPDLPRARPTVYVFGKAVGDDEHALHVSKNAGKTWTKVPTRQRYNHVTPNHLAADRQTFGRVYLGTPGLGIWYVQTDRLID